MTLGCRRKPNEMPVEFVVPDGFHGIFTVAFDPTSGQPVSTNNGHFVVVIPSEGKISIATKDVVSGKHSISARFKSGLEIPASGLNSNPAEMHFVDYDLDKQTFTWIIGTQQEADDASKRLRQSH